MNVVIYVITNIINVLFNSGSVGFLFKNFFSSIAKHNLRKLKWKYNNMVETV